MQKFPFIVIYVEAITYLLLNNLHDCTFNPIEDGGGGKNVFPTSFSPVTSTKVAVSCKNFFNFNFDYLSTLMENFNFIPSTSPKLWNLDQGHPSKKWFSWPNPYKFEVMITFLMETPELPNFGQRTTSTK